MIFLGRSGVSYRIAPHFWCNGTADNVLAQQIIDDYGSTEEIMFLGGGSPYILKTNLVLPSGASIRGDAGPGTTLWMADGMNKSVFINNDTTNGDERISIRDLTIDPNGSQQRSGGGASFSGLRDSLIENVTIKQAFNFNLFVHSAAGATLTGTFTFTKGYSTVYVTDGVLTEEIEKGSIIKSAGNRFGRVRAVLGNGQLKLDRPWGHATETGVTAKLIPPNARNRILNCTFEGTRKDDNVGLGLFDDSLVQGCVSRESRNYGFGPDHAHRLRFINNTCYGNSNAGIGMETNAYCYVAGNEMYRNDKGIFTLSGSYRNIIADNHCHDNTGNGIAVQYNSTLFATPDGNKVINNQVGANGTHGIRVSGAKYTMISGNHCFNNDQSGIIILTENSVVPDKNSIVGNICFDSQDVKTQDRGINVQNGTNTLVANNIAFDSDHNVAGIVDTGTATILADNITA